MPKKNLTQFSTKDDLSSPSHVRADARRNVEAIVRAAKVLFDTQGLDAPVRDVATKAGVGIGTLYRHFPKRADLIAAVFQDEIDELAQQALLLIETHKPIEALSEWMRLCARFITTKRGFANALRSGDPTVDALPLYFKKTLLPAMKLLLDTAAASGEARDGVDASDLLAALACLAIGAGADNGQLERTVAFLTDGVSFGANRP